MMVPGSQTDRQALVLCSNTLPAIFRNDEDTTIDSRLLGADGSKGGRRRKIRTGSTGSKEDSDRGGRKERCLFSERAKTTNFSVGILLTTIFDAKRAKNSWRRRGGGGKLE